MAAAGWAWTDGGGWAAAEQNVTSEYANWSAAEAAAGYGNWTAAAGAGGMPGNGTAGPLRVGCAAGPELFDGREEVEVRAGHARNHGML